MALELLNNQRFYFSTFSEPTNSLKKESLQHCKGLACVCNGRSATLLGVANNAKQLLKK